MTAALRLDEVTLGPVRVVSKGVDIPPPRRLKSWLAVQEKAKRPPTFLKNAIRAMGEYHAGTLGRTTALWGASAANANRAIRHSLTTMRARSRDLERNDPYARRFFDLVETNVVGPNGVTVQFRATDANLDGTLMQDTIANRILEREYSAFSERGQYDVTGQLSRSAYERLFMRTLARDGEVLEKVVSDPESRWGMRFQILECDWLDETYNDDLPNGNRVIMGVEMAPSGKPVAYWLRTRHPGDIHGASRGDRMRYPAGQVRHYFVQTRPEQVRGIPWLHAAMDRLYQLGEFSESAILAARLGADKLMMLEDVEGQAADMADGTLPSETGSDDDRDGALFFKSQKGSIDILPRGTKIAQWDPTYPSDTFGPFVLAALRGVASGCSVSYESISNDRNGVTWTSIRHAVLDERDHWMTIQDWLVQSKCRDSVTTWITLAFLSPAKPFDFLPAGKLAKLNAPEFFPRRWDWVNPKDDIDAEVAAIANKLTSHRRVLAKRGIDLEELLAEIRDDRAMAELFGLDLDTILAQKVDQQQGTTP